MERTTFQFAGSLDSAYWGGERGAGRFAKSLHGGRTRTVTLAVYSALESNLGPALVRSAVMVVLAFGVLLCRQALAARCAD